MRGGKPGRIRCVAENGCQGIARIVGNELPLLIGFHQRVERGLALVFRETAVLGHREQEVDLHLGSGAPDNVYQFDRAFSSDLLLHQHRGQQGRRIRLIGRLQGEERAGGVAENELTLLKGGQPGRSQFITGPPQGEIQVFVHRHVEHGGGDLHRTGRGHDAQQVDSLQSDARMFVACQREPKAFHRVRCHGLLCRIFQGDGASVENHLPQDTDSRRAHAGLGGLEARPIFPECGKDRCDIIHSAGLCGPHDFQCQLGIEVVLLQESRQFLG